MPAPTTTTLGSSLGTRPVGTPQTPLLTGTLRLYALGDSFTAGTGNSTLSWRQAAGEMLTDSGVAYTSVGGQSSSSTSWPNHRGVSGKTIAGATTDLTGTPTILSTADPDIVLMVPFGVNDIQVDAQTSAQTLTRMTALCEVIRAYTNGRGVTPRLLMCTILASRTSTAGQVTAINDYNAGLPALIATQVALGQKITLIDPRPALDSPLGTHRNDGLHPSNAGYRLIAGYVFAGLLNLIGLDAQWGRAVT